MKIIKDQKGYTTSVIIFILIIPLIMLMIITIEEYSHETENIEKKTEAVKIQSKTEDFEREIITITQQTLHETTLNITTTNVPIKDSRTYIKNIINEKIEEKEKKYKKDNIIINTSIKSVDSSDDPFKIEIKYHITATINNSQIKINRDEVKQVDITDSKYQVFDPLPVLKTGMTQKNNRINFEGKLSEIINLKNSDAYTNTMISFSIKKCPYDNYNQHGNDNQTISNCINNHYYHNSHDGMCLLCRMENKTSCTHYGFETFIIPTLNYDRAPASIDHVLLNDKNSQYMGNKIEIDNQTVLYLDNGHRAKYGL